MGDHFGGLSHNRGSYHIEKYAKGQWLGAVGGTRTLTPVTEQRPQRCASTNSATTAMSWTGLRFNSGLATCQVPNRKIPFRNGAATKSLSINAGQQNRTEAPFNAKRPPLSERPFD